MSKPSVEDRLSDVEIASVRASNAIAGMQKVFTSLDSKIDALGVEMASMAGRMDSMDSRMGSMDSRMGSMDKRMGSMDKRMDSMDGRIEELAKGQEAVVAETGGLRAWREEITPKIYKAVEHAENRGLHRH